MCAHLDAWAFTRSGRARHAHTAAVKPAIIWIPLLRWLRRASRSLFRCQRYSINTLRVNWGNKNTVFFSLPHIHFCRLWTLEALRPLTHTQTQAKDAPIRCMVKKYIYWNLCQCRKNVKTGFRFCHSTTGEYSSSCLPSSFGALHLAIEDKQRSCLVMPNTSSHRHRKAHAAPRTHY